MGRNRPLRALNFGDVLDQTIAFMRRDFRLWLKISAVVYVPIVVLQMVQLALVGPTIFDFSRLAQDQTAWADYGPAIIFWLLSSLVLGIASAFAFLLISAALTYGVSQRFLDRSVTVGGSYGAALRSLWGLILSSIVAILLFVLMIVVGAIPIGVAALVGLPNWAIAVVAVLSFLAMTVLSVYLFVRWSLMLPAIVVERAGPLRAFGRSSQLMKGLWWRTLGLLLLATLALYLLISLPSTIISIVAMGATMALRPDLTYLATILTTAIAALFTIVSAPVIPCVLTLLYYDARIRKEGFDLQVLAEQLGQSLPTAVEPQA